MSKFELKFNSGEIEGALKESFGETNELFGAESQQEITEPKWDWPVSPSPRDIVLDGQLRDSYEHRRISDTVHEHAWNARHAMANHEGAKYRNGRTRPARPWTKEPTENFEDNFEAIARVKLERVR